jgi:hypothetical protein
MSLLLVRDRGFAPPKSSPPSFEKQFKESLTLPATGYPANAHQTPLPTTEAIIVPAPPLIFHLKYHPRGLQRATVRNTFTTTLGPLLTTHEFIVAVSRAPSKPTRPAQQTLLCRTPPARTRLIFYPTAGTTNRVPAKVCFRMPGIAAASESKLFTPTWTQK